MEINITVEQANETIAVFHIKGVIDASNFVEVLDQAHDIYILCSTSSWN